MIPTDVQIELGAAALYGPEEEGDSLDARQKREGCRSLAEDILTPVLSDMEATVESLGATFEAGQPILIPRSTVLAILRGEL